MYSLVDSPLYYKLYHSGDSCNTGIQEYNTTFKKEETSKKKEGAKRDIHDAILDTDWANSPELDELLS